MLPAPRLTKSGSVRPAASVNAVCMSRTAAVSIAGVGGSKFDAKSWPVTSADVVKVVGGADIAKPVRSDAAAGLRPMSPTTDVTPVVETPDLARMTKFPAVPRLTTGGPVIDDRRVVNDHTLGVARLSPCRSRAPSEMCAVYTVFDPSVPTGFSVATEPA